MRLTLVLAACSLVLIGTLSWMVREPGSPETGSPSRRPVPGQPTVREETPPEPGNRRRRTRRTPVADPEPDPEPPTEPEHHRILRVGSACGGRKGPAELALDHFTKEQGKDGTWASGNPANTGAVLLTYLGYGETHRSGVYKQTVKNALRALRDAQSTEGWFTAPDGTVPPGRGAVAALAVTEAYGLTGSKLFRELAQKAADAVADALVPGSGWSRAGEWQADVEAGTWSAMVLVSARGAELEIRSGLSEEALHALRQFGTPGDVALSLREAAMLTTARSFLGDRVATTPDVAAGVARLVTSPPRPEGERADPEYIYFGTLACLRAGGKSWKTWERALTEHVWPHFDQDENSPTTGRWKHLEDLPEADRLYGSALLEMAYLSYNRYGGVFGRE